MSCYSNMYLIVYLNMTHWLQLVSDLDRKLKIFYLKEKKIAAIFLKLNLSWYHYIPWPWKPLCRVKKQYIICHSQEFTVNLRKFINGRRFFLQFPPSAIKKRWQTSGFVFQHHWTTKKTLTQNPPPHRGWGSMVGPRSKMINFLQLMWN